MFSLIEAESGFRVITIYPVADIYQPWLVNNLPFKETVKHGTDTVGIQGVLAELHRGI